MNRPHVVERWGGPISLEGVRAKYRPRVGGGPVCPYIAYRAGLPTGFIQSYRATQVPEWPDEHDPGVVGIDQFLADASQLGKGLGTAMISAFVATLFEDPRVTCIQTDPSPDNPRAIRCYEKVGFRRVGFLERPDGLALLMEDAP